jgi:hypothetical protein
MWKSVILERIKDVLCIKAENIFTQFQLNKPKLNILNLDRNKLTDKDKNSKKAAKDRILLKCILKLYKFI